VRHAHTHSLQARRGNLLSVRARAINRCCLCFGGLLWRLAAERDSNFKEPLGEPPCPSRMQKIKGTHTLLKINHTCLRSLI